MKFKTQAFITGAKSYNDIVDGTHHNFTKIYVMTALSDVGVGSCTVEYKWGTSENISKIQDMTFPFEAMLDMEITTNANRQLTIIHDVKPLPTKGI